MDSRKVHELIMSLDNKLVKAQETVDAKILNATKLVKCTVSTDPAIKSIEEINNEFKMVVDEIRGCMENVKKLFIHVNNTLDDHEAYSRRNCLLLHGLEENQDESIEKIVLRTIGDMKIPNWTLKLEMIDRCHRIGPKEKNAAQS